MSSYMGSVTARRNETAAMGFHESKATEPSCQEPSSHGSPLNARPHERRRGGGQRNRQDLSAFPGGDRRVLTTTRDQIRNKRRENSRYSTVVGAAAGGKGRRW
jgi:hypothetical protein